MIELTPKQLIDELCALLPLTPPRAVALVGAPGMAKTESVRQAAAALGAVLLVEHPLLREPVDYAGLPWVVDGKVEQLPMAFLRRVQETASADPERLVIVFFDDVGQAPSATQAALMQFVQERCFASQPVPDNVRFVLATNRRKDKAGVGGVLAPLTNRLRVFGVSLDADAWAEWAHKSGLPPELVAYVRFKPDCLSDPESQSNRDIEPFCSARTLEQAGRDMLAGITRHAVLAASIGESRATELGAFVKVWGELPDIDEVLANPKRAIVPKANRPDIAYAMIGALAHRVDAGRMANLCVYIDRLSPELAVACLKDAQAQKPELRKTKAFVDWLLAHKDILGLDDEKAEK